MIGVSTWLRLMQKIAVVISVTIRTRVRYELVLFLPVFSTHDSRKLVEFVSKLHFPPMPNPPTEYVDDRNCEGTPASANGLLLCAFEA